MVRLQQLFQKTNFWASVILPFGLFALHAWIFRNWIIDDAGISFAYARNLAYGYGLVSQPGTIPVEGFSNPLWVMVFTPFFLTRSFYPAFTPKAVSMILVLASFLSIHRIFKLISKHADRGTGLVLTFLAANTSFVAWTTSGLENPLYVLLTVLLLWQIIEFGSHEANNSQAVFLIALLAALCALTRPDGILFSLVFPVVTLAKSISQKSGLGHVLKASASYVGAFAVIFGAYAAFRYLYFHDIAPNTYYAKGGPSFSLLYGYWKAMDLLQNSVFPRPLLISLVALVYYAWITRSATLQRFTLSIFLLISAAIYILLPTDWMPEYRFATPFLVFLFMYVFVLSETTIENARRKVAVAIPIVCSLILLAIANAYSFSIRTQNFANNPPISFAFVSKVYGERFNEYARVLGVRNGSILVPDVGGTLYYSKLRVYDLAGLTDKVIANSLGRSPTTFYDYVFTELKPTFIHTHEWWAYAANLDGDPRFRRDYVPIRETIDAWVMDQFGTVMFSGDYVRKDAVGGDMDRLRSLK